jgi:hypothetical protein
LVKPAPGHPAIGEFDPAAARILALRKEARGAPAITALFFAAAISATLVFGAGVVGGAALQTALSLLGS